MLWVKAARFDPDPMDPNAGDIWVYDGARDTAGDIYVVGSSKYWDGDEWLESAMMLESAGPRRRRGLGQVYDSSANAESYFTQVAVRGTSVVGVGSTWPDPEDALVVR